VFFVIVLAITGGKGLRRTSGLDDHSAAEPVSISTVQ